MPAKRPRPCTRCGAPIVRNGMCSRHLAMHYRMSDQRRGSATARGYGTEHKNRFRPGVLQRDNYTCQVCGGWGNVADHYPESRVELIAAGRDPDDPDYGRCLCKLCHDTHTAKTQGARNLDGTRD